MTRVTSLVFTLFFPLFTMAYIPVETKPGEQNEIPEAIVGVGIDEKINDFLPGDVQFLFPDP